MESKKLCFIVFCIVSGLASLWGQSNERIDEFLEQERADIKTSLLFLGQSLQAIPEDGGTAEALSWAEQQRWWKTFRHLSPEDPLPLGRFFLVLFQSYGIKGDSLMYFLFKTPRYAARDAFEQGFYSGTSYYNRDVSPSEVLFALSMAMEVSHE